MRAANQQPAQAQAQATQQTMNVTAEHAGGAVVLELDEGCRSVAALQRIISAALPDVREDGFDVTVQGRAVEDVDVCGLEEGATIQVVVSRRVVALAALRAAGRDVSEGGLEDGMFEAVYDGDVALCEQYLDAGCDVNARHDSGDAPLHIAASTRHPDICRLLLQHGADVNQRGRGSCTPLHHCFLLPVGPAAHAVREVLLSHGADMHAVDNYGKSALDRAQMESKQGFSNRNRVARRGDEWHKQLSPYDALEQFVKYGAPNMRWSNPCREVHPEAGEGAVQGATV